LQPKPIRVIREIRGQFAAALRAKPKPLGDLCVLCGGAAADILVLFAGGSTRLWFMVQSRSR